VLFTLLYFAPDSSKLYSACGKIWADSWIYSP
jgi:hypothetical protein